MKFVLNSQKVKKISLEQTIDFFIDFIEWYEYTENGSMHQCYDFDKEGIKTILKHMFVERSKNVDKIELIVE